MYNILLINFKHIHTLHMVKNVSCIHINCWMYNCMCLYQVTGIVPTCTHESIPPSVMGSGVPISQTRRSQGEVKSPAQILQARGRRLGYRAASMSLTSIAIAREGDVTASRVSLHSNWKQAYPFSSPVSELVSFWVSVSFGTWPLSW